MYAVACYTTQAGAVRVVSGSRDNTVRIWDPETQKLMATLGHTNVRAVASYTTQAGAVRVVSGSWDKTIRISGTRTRRVSSPRCWGTPITCARGRELHDTGRRRARRERLVRQDHKDLGPGDAAAPRHAERAH